jgi:hypothetical protein|tara:strand:- start:309 stop:680 length:372 start_codon:yes stop_codon:yes gene_type:complete
MATLKEDKLIIKDKKEESGFSGSLNAKAQNIVVAGVKTGWDLIVVIWIFLRDELPQFFSNWRTVPRLMMALYAWMAWDTLNWFTALENPTTPQAGLISVVVGAGAAWFGLYVNGKKTDVVKKK